MLLACHLQGCWWQGREMCPFPVGTKVSQGASWLQASERPGQIVFSKENSVVQVSENLDITLLPDLPLRTLGSTVSRVAIPFSLGAHVDTSDFAAGSFSCAPSHAQHGERARVSETPEAWHCCTCCMALAGYTAPFSATHCG